MEVSSTLNDELAQEIIDATVARSTAEALKDESEGRLLDIKENMEACKAQLESQLAQLEEELMAEEDVLAEAEEAGHVAALAYRAAMARINEKYTDAKSSLSPPASTPCGATLRRCFPGALPSSTLHEAVSEILEAEGLTPENTLYGQSLCSDEINNEAGGTGNLMMEHWGVNNEHFPLGGIGGAPYVGKTGFGAFSGHVPDGGNVIMLFGPHIGISDEGVLGKFLRHGQHKCSTACGAVVGAYKACEAGKGRESDPNDMQQVWLEKHIGSSMERINSAEEPMEELMRATFEHIEQEVDTIVHTKFSAGKLVLIGGIQLNIGKPFADHFLPLSFRVLQTGQPERTPMPQLIEAAAKRY